MILAYRYRRLSDDWSLFSDNSNGGTRQEVIDWLSSVGYSDSYAGKWWPCPEGSPRSIRELVFVDNPPDELKMLIKLTFPNLVNLFSGS